ncbi:hypothetical protein CLU81_5187 [Flavobacterium sp. 9]|uniref:hypothetical protein n=1 Tax=Flavobacterium sp. 9 TaxID=2035198 RepID=UPI000C18598E|nr:hypothetical protein [Flavobacterium sp. 9]PIF34532.1 hypothetical protein CLU81_5187 [Flavobacterium sp. 9]
MPISGSDFEKIIKPFFQEIFEEMGYIVFQVRQQTAGTQDGFDISVLFLDFCGLEREMFFECKYYTSSALQWSDIFNKQLQLKASSHKPCAFICLSPLKDLSNIDHNLQANIVKNFKYPVDFWTPDKKIETLFALNIEVYKKVYDVAKCNISFDRDKELRKYRAKIDLMIQQKDLLQYSDLIKIEDVAIDPIEDINLKTAMDEKLNAILSVEDPKRIEFHRLRANYKVFLESLVDLNPELRDNILRWESNLRLKASRLTDKFNIDSSYSTELFFHDFFEEAEKDMLTFYSDFNLKGDREKLLNGVVFELAAQCPLDWRKNGKA